jgi:hypothetical protein
VESAAVLGAGREQDGQAECSAELPAGVQQRRGQAAGARFGIRGRDKSRGWQRGADHETKQDQRPEDSNRVAFFGVAGGPPHQQQARHR